MTQVKYVHCSIAEHSIWHWVTSWRFWISPTRLKMVGEQTWLLKHVQLDICIICRRYYLSAVFFLVFQGGKISLLGSRKSRKTSGMWKETKRTPSPTTSVQLIYSITNITGGGKIKRVGLTVNQVSWQKHTWQNFESLTVNQGSWRKRGLLENTGADLTVKQDSWNKNGFQETDVAGFAMC